MEKDDACSLPEGSVQGADCSCYDSKEEDDQSNCSHVVPVHSLTFQLGNQWRSHHVHLFGNYCNFLLTKLPTLQTTEDATKGYLYRLENSEPVATGNLETKFQAITRYNFCCWAGKIWEEKDTSKKSWEQAVWFYLTLCIGQTLLWPTAVCAFSRENCLGTDPLFI